MYFLIRDLAALNNMYQTSLAVFLQLFKKALDAVCAVCTVCQVPDNHNVFLCVFPSAKYRFGCIHVRFTLLSCAWAATLCLAGHPCRR